MQEKTSRRSTFAQQVGLKISQKTEVMMLNVQNPAPVKVNGEDLATTEEFTYLGSRHDDRAGNDINNRLSKPRNAFRMMNNAWRLSQYSNKTKVRLYQRCVLSTLLYGWECWRKMGCDRNKLSTFHTKHLRRILLIFWPETISKKQLLPRCNQESMEIILMRRRWGWIRHVTRREQDSITGTALHWTPEGKRKRGRHKNTWRRTMSYYGRGAQDPTAHLGNYSETVPEKTGVAILCFCPTCLTAFMGMSEWVIPPHFERLLRQH